MNDQKSYYETMYILRPDIAEDEVTNHIDKYNKLLKEFGGTILDSQMRGKRRLAYQIANIGKVFTCNLVTKVMVNIFSKLKKQ